MNLLDRFIKSLIVFIFIFSNLQIGVFGLDLYPKDPPYKGMRMSLIDTDGVLSDLVYDFAPRDGQEEFDLGKALIYGDSYDDRDSTDSYDNLKFEFDGKYPQKFAFITENASNTKNIIYDVIAIEGNTTGSITNVYEFTDVKEKPELGISDFETVYDNALEKGKKITAPGSYQVEGTNGLIINSLLKNKVGATNQQIGDPEVLADYLREVMIYMKYDDDKEYAFVLDLETSKIRQDIETKPVIAGKIITRGKIGRLDFALPAVSDGIVDYQVEISGSSVTGPQKYITKSPVIFFSLDFGDDIEALVYSRNAEGTKSDVFEFKKVDSDVVNIDKELNDIKDSVFKDQITYLYKLGIIDGLNGSFYPKYEVSRDQMAKFIMNAFKIPFNIGGEQFPDVKPDNPFFSYIQSLKNAGIISGMSSGIYMPAGYVDRGGVTKFIVNAARYYDKDAIGEGKCSFSDGTTKVFETFEEYICALVDFGDGSTQQIISGYSSGSFGAADKLDRGAMSKMIMNSAAMIPKVNALDTDLDGDPDTFININGKIYGTGRTFTRPFVAPIEAEDFDAVNATYESVEVTWNDLSKEDTSLDGYILQKKESTSEEWKNVEIETAKASSTLFIESVPTDGEYIKVGTCKVTFEKGAGTGNNSAYATDNNCLTDNVAKLSYYTVANPGVLLDEEKLTTLLSTLINVSDTEYKGLTVSKIDDQLVKFEDTLTTDNVTAHGVGTVDFVDNTNGAIKNIATYTVGWTNSNDSGILLKPNVGYTDFDIKNSKSYDYRLAAFKFIPYDFANDDYANQSAMESSTNYDELDTKVIGQWVETNIKTPDKP